MRFSAGTRLFRAAAGMGTLPLLVLSSVKETKLQRSKATGKGVRIMGSMKQLMSLLISGALIAGSGGAAMAQQSNKDKDSVKQTTKDVANDTKNAAKATGKAVKKTTKKVVHKAAAETKKGAGKVEDKTNLKK